MIHKWLIQSTHQVVTFCPWVDLYHDLCHRDLDLCLRRGQRLHHVVLRSQAVSVWHTSTRQVAEEQHHRIYSRRVPMLLQAVATCSNTTYKTDGFNTVMHIIWLMGNIWRENMQPAKIDGKMPKYHKCLEAYGLSYYFCRRRLRSAVTFIWNCSGFKIMFGSRRLEKVMHHCWQSDTNNYQLLIIG